MEKRVSIFNEQKACEVKIGPCNTVILKVHGQISKSGVSKGNVYGIKHANFQLYRAHPVGVIWIN